MRKLCNEIPTLRYSLVGIDDQIGVDVWDTSGVFQVVQIELRNTIREKTAEDARKTWHKL